MKAKLVKAWVWSCNECSELFLDKEDCENCCWHKDDFTHIKEDID